MKKILSFLLVAILCISLLTSCEAIDSIKGLLGIGGGEQDIVADDNLDGALEYVTSYYASLDNSTKIKDIEVAAQVAIAGVKYPITWTVDNDAVVVRESTKLGFMTVDIPSDNAVDITFVLTATISNSKGETRVKSFTITVPASGSNELNVSQAIAIGSGTKDGEYTANKFYVTGKVTSIKNETYGNLYIADEEGNEFYIYGLYDVSGKIGYDKMTTKPVVGDTITVYGVIGNYKGDPQMKNGWLTHLNGEELKNESGLPTAAATLDMNGTATRTEYSTEKVVHSANGITYTNEKNTSITDCYDETKGYAARAYTGSIIKIEYTGMTMIVFTLDDYSPEAGKDYLKGFDGMTVEGATITRDHDLVKIIFNEATDVFVSAALFAQIRIESIDVYTCEVDVPVTPPVEDEFDAPETGKAYKLYIEQGTYDQILYFAGTLDAEKSSYLATTETYANSVDIFFEATEGGYHIYFMSGETKNYINAAPYIKTNGFAGCHFEFGAAPNCVWTYNTVYGTLEVYGEIEGKSDTFFAGTYGEYKTISLSGIYYRPQIADGTQFPARIILSSAGEVTPPAHEHKFVNGKCECGEEDPNYVPPTTEGPKALTSLKTGDKVYIVCPSHNMALSADKVSAGSYYNKGVDVSGGFSGLTNAEVWVVTVNADGSYTFTSVTGSTLALGDSYSSFNDAGANKYWTLEEVSTGVYKVKNTGRGLYIEWYAEKGNWSAFGTASSNLFEISFFAHELAEGGEVTPPAHTHTFVEGKCECGETDPTYTPPTGGDTTTSTLPGNLAFASAENKANADTYMNSNFPEWTITGKLGQTYGGYLGFGRSGDKQSAITSSTISTNKAFTVTTVLKGNGDSSTGIMTSTLTFTLVDANGNTVATGYANGSTTAAITPVHGADTTYNISFTFVEGKTWSDVTNLVVSFAKATGNIGLKSLNFVQ